MDAMWELLALEENSSVHGNNLQDPTHSSSSHDLYKTYTMFGKVLLDCPYYRSKEFQILERWKRKTGGRKKQHGWRKHNLKKNSSCLFQCVCQLNRISYSTSEKNQALLVFLYFIMNDLNNLNLQVTAVSTLILSQATKFAVVL